MGEGGGGAGCRGCRVRFRVRDEVGCRVGKCEGWGWGSALTTPTSAKPADTSATQQPTHLPALSTLIYLLCLLHLLYVYLLFFTDTRATRVAASRWKRATARCRSPAAVAPSSRTCPTPRQRRCACSSEGLGVQDPRPLRRYVRVRTCVYTQHARAPACLPSYAARVHTQFGTCMPRA